MPQSRVGRFDLDELSTLAESPEHRLKILLRRGPRVPVFEGLDGVLEDPSTPVGGLVDRPPTLDAKATKELDGSRIRLVLLKVDTTDGGRAVGATAQLFAADGVTLLDSARVDRRGLVLLRFPRAVGRDLSALDGKIGIGTSTPLLDVKVPQGVQHAVVRAVIDPADVVGVTGATVGAATTTVESASGEVESTGASVDDAAEALKTAAEALAAASGSTSDVDDAAAALANAAQQLADAEVALADAAAALGSAAETLESDAPVDSVISRLPPSFSPALGDSVARLLTVSDGPIPGIDSATDGISTSRMPLIKELTVVRVVGSANTQLRRFLVRIRQEWVFVGLTLGELVRVDALDPASVTGTLDATLTASAHAGLTLDAATASRLEAELSGQLSAWAAINSALDIAVGSQLRGSLDANVSAGLFPTDFSGLLPIAGADASASLNASLNLHAHTDLSVSSSLLAAAHINAAASLVNEARVRVSAALAARATVNAKLVAQINPSLAQAVNLLRFVLYDVYSVTSSVEDVVELIEQKVFSDPPSQSPPRFSAGDIVEYRPYFQRALLEPRLAPNFEIMRRSLSEARSGGDPISTVRVAVEYSATGLGGDLTVRIGDMVLQLRLPAGSSLSTGAVGSIAPVRPRDLTEARLTLTQHTNFPFPPNSTAQVSRIEIRYENSAFLDDLGVFPAGALQVGPTQVTAQNTMQLNPLFSGYNPINDSLFLHINNNEHYYLGVLATAAIRVPSLRQDAEHLAEIGIDSPLWRLPLLGFVGDRALIVTEPSPDDPDVRKLVADEGTSTIVQLAATGLYTEAAQGRMKIDAVAGLSHPGLGMAQPPLPNITGLDILSNAGGLGAPNLTGALGALGPLLQQSPGLANLAVLANLLEASRPPAAPAVPNIPGV
jgi:hypothetical protein